MIGKLIMTWLTSHLLLSFQSILFLLLNVLDGWTTWLVMKPDHYDRERNPIARFVFKKLKAPASIILFKVMLLSGLGLFIIHWWRESLTLNIALLVGNLLYIYVVRHNFKVHRKYVEHEQFFENLKSYKVVVE